MLMRALRSAVRFERQTEIEDVREWIRPVGLSASEAKRLVKRDCFAHGIERVENQSIVADATGGGDGRRDQGAGKPAPPVGGNHIKAFQLADGLGKRTKADATGCETVCTSEKKGSSRWSITAGQRRHLAVDMLQSEVNGKRGGILLEKFADGDDVAVSSDLNELVHGARA